MTVTGVPGKRSTASESLKVLVLVHLISLYQLFFADITAGLFPFASERLVILAPYPKFCWSRVPTRIPTWIHLVEVGQIAFFLGAVALLLRYLLTGDHVFRIRSASAEGSWKLPIGYFR